MMKIICDCGNEDIFDTINRDTGEQNNITEEEGQYANINSFNLWQSHDVVGIVCEKCGKAIWCFC